MTKEYDFDDEAKKINQEKDIAQKRHLKSVRLTKCKGEIAQLRSRNISYANITKWIAKEFHIKVNVSTVRRFCEDNGIIKGELP